MSAVSDPWSAFAHDPREPAASRLRAGDADREIIHRMLGDAFAEGRLDREEYDERSSSALVARTLGELPPLVADLVPVRPLTPPAGSSLVSATPADIEQRAVQEWQSSRRNAVIGFVGSSLVCWAIWIAGSLGSDGLEPYFPWPLIVMAVSLMNVIRIVAGKDEIIAEEVRELERRRAKKLKALEKRRRDQGEDGQLA